MGKKRRNKFNTTNAIKHLYKKLKKKIYKKTKDKKERISKKVRVKKKQSAPYTGKASNSAKAAKKRAKKLGRLDPNANSNEISKIYLKCRALNKKAHGHVYDIDHIVPFFAGGLHHEDNLQIIEVEAHKIKTNEDLLKYV